MSMAAYACIKKKIAYSSLNNPLIKFSADLSLKCVLIKWVFSYKII